ncbi:MAG: VWA domain-containing protein, partial [Rubrivivax sp.]
RDLSAWFLLDLSGSVDFGSGDVTKLAVSSGFVAALARVLTRHGNRVGAVLYGHKVDTVLRPGASRVHVLELLQRMRAPRPPVRGGQGTALYDLLATADGVIRRRSLVFVVSDFISAPGWEDALGRLAQRHDVVAIRLFDPLEMALPDVGLVTVEDAETGEQLFIDSTDPAFRARYAALADAAEAQLATAFARAGVDCLELATDDDLLAALLRFADLRRRRAFGAHAPPVTFAAHLSPTPAAVTP